MENSDSAAQAAGAVRAVVRRVRRRLLEVSSADDLTLAQWSVLVRLDQEGPATASALAAAERVRPQSMAATVAALLEPGLVERAPDPDDGRRQVLSLSAAGRRRLHDARRARQEWLTRTLQERCTESQRRQLIEALTLLDEVTRA